MRSARLRHRITLQKKQWAEDDYGQKTEQWIDQGMFAAGIEPITNKGANNETYKNHTWISEAEVLVIMRFNPNINIDSTKQILFKQRTYEILGAINIEMRDKELHVYAKEVL